MKTWRRLPRQAHRWTGLVAAAAVLVLALGVCSADAAQSTGLDPRVESAVAQLPGTASHEDQVWVTERLSAWKAAGIRDCLAQNGREDLWPRVGEVVAGPAQMPDFSVPSPRMLTEVGIDWRRAPDAHATISEQDFTLWECDDAADTGVPHPGAETTQLYEDLQNRWHDELVPVLEDPAYDPQKRAVNQCLVDGGATIDTRDDGSTGAGWEAEFTLGAESVDAMTDAQTLEAGRLLARCAAPLWSAWHTELMPKKAKFLREHHTELARLCEDVKQAA